MRKLISFVTCTLDGYYEGPQQEFDWPVVDDDFNRFSVEQLDSIDALVLGRVTYEGFAAYWSAAQDDPEIASRMNAIPKIVVSRTLDKAGWTNTRLVRDPAALGPLKQEPGRDLAIFGSSNLTVELLRLGLVDELRLMVNPVVLGAGKSVFHGASPRVGLRLATVRTFASGNLLLTYQPV